MTMLSSSSTRTAATVGDVMHPGVVAAHEYAAFNQIVDSLVRNGIGAVPVIDADRRVVGVVSESDLLAAMSSGPVTARELMTTPAVVAQRGMSATDAAQLAAQTRVHRLPVVDVGGVLIGIVTAADLLNVVVHEDEIDERRRG